MRNFFTIFFLLIVSITAMASPITDLEQAIKESDSDEEKMELYYQLAELYNNAGQYNKASQNASAAYKLAIEFDSDLMKAKSGLLDGQVSLELNKDEKALIVLKEALKYAKKANKEVILLSTLNTLGDYYKSKKDYYKSIEYKDAAISLLQKANGIAPMPSSSDSEKTPSEKRASSVTDQKYLNQISELESEKIDLLTQISSLRKKIGSTDTAATNMTTLEKEELLKALNDKEQAQEAITERLKMQSNELKKMKRKDLENEALAGRLDAELNKAKLQEVEYQNKQYLGFAAAGFIGLILFFTWLRMRFHNKKKKELEQKNTLIEESNKRSEELLLNILPVHIADELKSKGKVKARKFNQASVLFTDFKGFSLLSEKYSPEELVYELDHCFKAFDYIIKQYKDIEKIKTIGDAYMCASGLSENTTFPINLVNAALEMQTFMNEYKQQKVSQGKPYFEARIGIHTGPVVAGVVGFDKFAYDIWGATVNIASRMESNSEPGKVNISDSTYRLIGHKFECQHRGKIKGKNIGDIDSYFVNSTKKSVYSQYKY